MADPKKITFVLGAGFSNTVGLPLGGELKEFIADVIYYYFKEKSTAMYPSVTPGYSIENFLQFLDQEKRDNYTQLFIRDTFREVYFESMLSLLNIFPTLNEAELRIIEIGVRHKQSIDRFLYDSRSNSAILDTTKKLISTCLEAGMSKCSVVLNEEGMFKNTRSLNSYQLLYQYIASQFDFDTRKKIDGSSHISIVNFNYDSTFDFFVYKEIYNYYASQYIKSVTLEVKDDPLSRQAAKDLFNIAEIKHVYGELLDKNNYIENVNILGCNGDWKNILFMGQDKNPSHWLSIQSTVMSSDTIVFLGFGFDRQNLDLLFDVSNEDYNPHKKIHIIATSYRETSYFEGAVRSYFEEKFDGYKYKCDLHNVSAKELLKSLQLMI